MYIYTRRMELYMGYYMLSMQQEFLTAKLYIQCIPQSVCILSRLHTTLQHIYTSKICHISTCNNVSYCLKCRWIVCFCSCLQSLLAGLYYTNQQECIHKPPTTQLFPGRYKTAHYALCAEQLLYTSELASGSQ